MPSGDHCSITVRFRLGWRWRMAAWAVRVLPHLGVELRPCLAVLNWGLSGASLKIGNGNTGWVPARLPKIECGDLA